MKIQIHDRAFFVLVAICLISGCSTNRESLNENNSQKDSIALQNDSIQVVNRVEETEQEEADRLMRERSLEDEKAFAELGVYDGKYLLSTENEGANGSLELKYNGEKVFIFKLSLKVPDVCDGLVEGEVSLDRTQHGLYQHDNCLLHFNFMGYWADSGYVVEIEQPEQCGQMEGNCTFTGKYITGLN